MNFRTSILPLINKFLCPKSVVLFLLMFSCLTTFSQYTPNPLREVYIDEGIFPTCIKGSSDLGNLVNQGYKGFVFRSGATLSDGDIRFLENYLSTPGEVSLAFIFEGKPSKFNELKELCKSYQIPLDKNNIFAIKDKPSGKKGVIWIEKVEDWITYVKVSDVLPKELFYKNSPSNWFSLFNSQNTPTDSLINCVKNYLNRTGKFANFILTKSPKAVESIAKQLPLTLKVETPDSTGNPLSSVRWSDIPGLTTYGIAHLHSDKIRFMDKTNDYRGKLNAIPVKEGYSFIPEMFTFNTNTYVFFKRFESKKLDLRQRLAFYIPLNTTAKFEGIVVTDNNLNIEKDDKGKYAHFGEEGNSFFFQAENAFDLQNEFSVSFWINPGETENNYGILSSNNYFVVKIRKGHLCLTIPGVADLISDKLELDKNQWQQISLVFLNGEWVKYYKNGQLIETRPIGSFDLKPNNHFVLGYNQWEEYYLGGLKQVVLWKRALSDEELQRVFEYKTNFEPPSNKKWYWGLALIALLTLGIYFYTKKKKNVPKRSKVINPPTLVPSKNLITCFNGFEFFDEKGEELLQNLSLKKKVFLFIILFYNFKKGGISPSELSDIMWPGYTPQNAKNIRSTYLQNIRSVIPEELMEIIYSQKTWTVRLAPHIKCELETYFKLRPEIEQIRKFKKVNLHNSSLDEYLNLVSQGEFLGSLSAETLDNFKAEVNLDISENLEFLLSDLAVAENPSSANKIACALSKYDPVNEQALMVKIKSLIPSHRTKAQAILDQFTREWKQMYGETYKVPSTIIDLLK